MSIQSDQWCLNFEKIEFKKQFWAHPPSSLYFFPLNFFWTPLNSKNKYITWNYFSSQNWTYTINSELYYRNNLPVTSVFLPCVLMWIDLDFIDISMDQFFSFFCQRYRQTTMSLKAPPSNDPINFESHSHPILMMINWIIKFCFLTYLRRPKNLRDSFMSGQIFLDNEFKPDNNN